MESLVLQPILKVIFEKLASLAVGKLTTLASFKKDTTRLKDQLRLISAVIQDAEERQVRDETVRHWLDKLQSVAYDADDLLDRIQTEALQRSTTKKVRFLSHIIPIFDSSRFRRELKGIQKTIADLVSEITSLNLRSEVRYSPYETSERPQTGIFVNESQVFGRGKDVRMIVQMLLSSSSDGNGVSRSPIPVLPIVGMGGIGKTTLAQLVYNNPDIQNNFDLKIWISVGKNFDVRKLIRDILEYTGQMGVCGFPLPQLGFLQSRLQGSLSGRKYLLVLDDVWNVNEAQWVQLREPLSCGIGGSKIVVTTRSQAAAMRMGASASSYALKPLADNDCWTLFRQLVFPNGGEEDYPMLTDIGKDVVKKCGGIPLAAEVLGKLLHCHRDEREWLNVQHSEIWDLQDNSILSALSLSYVHLPSNHKRCFSYCSVFPKNYDISREKMIHQWIAEGLISSRGDGTSYKKMEDIANEYFNNLVWMSLFEAVSYSEDGRVADFRVHNLIHDLALSAYKVVPEKSGQVELFICRAERRAYIVCNTVSPATFNPLCFEKLRTLQLICPRNDLTEILPTLFMNLRQLRVLSMNDCGIAVLHESIGSLVYLRYLDISNNLISRLPETICRLVNLQSLNLSSCRALKKLPSKISSLINLRHLNIQGCVSLSGMPANMGRYFTNLQTLPIFIVGESRGESLFQLEHLDLRGVLKIKHLENVGHLLPASCLQDKLLHILSLSWGDDNGGNVGRNTPRQNFQGSHGHDVEQVLDCLVPSRNVRVLQINGYSGAVFPQWINKLVIPNLTKLALVNCKRCETLPTLGQLPFLKYLEMRGLDEVEKIANEFYGREGKIKPFSSLNELILEDFAKLRSWESVESIEVFPCLQTLCILRCPSLTSMPRFPVLQHLEMQECHDLLLSSACEVNLLLTSLRIYSFRRICSLPASIGALTALKSLCIDLCDALETLPREMLSLTNLETLEIIECHGLVSIPDESIQGLKSLRYLSIDCCYNLESLPQTLRNLNALEHLTIMFCLKLAYLPNVMQEFQALRSLSIVQCKGLRDLPSGLRDVSSLRNLEIRGCPELHELPDWIENLVSLRSLAISECKNIKVLPEGLGHLQELQHLSIRDCPDLELRCQKDTGEDWPKISHVPFKHVGPQSPPSKRGWGDATASCFSS